MASSEPVRDFIYLDIERLRSIVAQLEKGVVDTVENSRGSESQIDAEVEGSLLRVIRGAGGSRFLWQRGASETRTLHDYLFNRVEEGLLANRFLKLIPENLGPDEVRSESGESKLAPTDFLLARGFVTLNDFGRMKAIVERFNDLGKFIAYCSVSSEPSENRKELQRKRREMEEKMQVPRQLQQGLVQVIDSFYGDRIVVKLTPYTTRPSLKFVGNLRPEYLREEIDALIFKYGTAPQAEWTLMAQVASCPGPEEPEVVERTGKPASIEVGFERMFDSVRTMEAMLKPIPYPEIAVTPVALYRE